MQVTSDPTRHEEADLKEEDSKVLIPSPESLFLSMVLGMLGLSTCALY